jgi:hypothetical protein
MQLTLDQLNKIINTCIDNVSAYYMEPGQDAPKFITDNPAAYYISTEHDNMGESDAQADDYTEELAIIEILENLYPELKSIRN